MGFIVKAVKSVVKAVVGVVSKVVGAVFGFSVGSKTAAKAKTTNTLNKSLEPEAYRKIIFGRMASPLDLRFWEVWGANGSRYDEVLATAGHRINAYLELYMENDLAISATGVVQPKFAGVLSRDTRLGAPGQTAIAVGSGTQWTNTATFDGVPHIKLAWVPDEKKLPNGIPSRYTQVTEGALVYDPRRDSTVPGGAGPHRANDRSTWSYATLDGNGQPIGRNNALQALWYLLGWTVPTAAGGEMLVCGRGVDPQDINLASFIAGANACEVAGYYTDMVLSTEDTHTSNEDKITCSGLIGRLIDPGGLWSYYANVDDTANIAVELTDADIIQGVTINWNEYESMSAQFNQVSGKFVNPSPTTLFQAFPYPMVRDATYEANLGIKRRKPQDFEQVLDGVLAQRLARLLLNQGQYQGEFSAGFNYRALKAQAWSVVRYTSDRFGWTKLFRVYRHDISTDAGIGMLLKEIDPSIWGAGTVTPPMAPGLGTNYQANQEIPLTGLDVDRTTVQGTGENATTYDAANVTWDAPPVTVRRTEVRYRIVGTTYWETSPSVERGTATNILIYPLIGSSPYEVQARHISINEVAGPWAAVNDFVSGNNGNLTYAGIVDAGTKADWPNVRDPDGTKPDDNATKGAPAGTLVAGKPAEHIVDATDKIPGLLDFDLSTSIAQNQIAKAAGLLDDSVLRSIVNNERTRTIMRSAGISVDPANGVVRISAIDQLAERTVATEIAVDAVKGQITQKVTYNDMNTAIAMAVLNPSQIAEFGAIIGRISDAESRLDAAESAISLRATLVEFGKTAARVVDAEQRIDALEGEIVTKVEQTVFDDLKTDFSTVKQTIQSLGDFGQYSVDIYAARAVADNAQDGRLRQLAFGELADKRRIVQEAQAKQDTYARISDGLATEAGQRLTLQVRVADFEGKLLQETYLRTTAIGIVAGQLDTLGISFRNQAAAISRLEEATIGYGGGIAGVSMTIRQQIDQFEDDAVEALKSIVAGEKAQGRLARQLVQIQTEFGTTLIANERVAATAREALAARLGAAEAAIVTTSNVAAEATKAVASRTSIIELALNNPVTGLAYAHTRITDEKNARVEAGKAIAESIEGVESELEGQKSSVQFLLRAANGQEAIARLLVGSSGRFTGFMVNGQTREFDIEADHFRVGGNGIFEVDTQDGVVRMRYVEVERIKAGVVDTPQLANSAVQRMNYTILQNQVVCPVGN